MTLEEMAAASRKLANELFSTRDGLACIGRTPTQAQSCIQLEEDRPLTREEKLFGWTRRPFDGYRPEKMCCACAAYWHAERCAQVLHRMHCLEVRAESKKKAEAASAKGGAA